jgi:hypothetical protein
LEFGVSDSDNKTTDVTETKESSAIPQSANAVNHKWYVVNVHSGMEYKAKLSLEERVRSLKKEDLISEVIVPEETVVELVKGQKKTTKRKFFPLEQLLQKLNLLFSDCVRALLRKALPYIPFQSARLPRTTCGSLHSQTEE